MLIYATHREIAERHLKATGRASYYESDGRVCPGRLEIDPDTMESDTSWIAECDVCGLELGVTPKQGSQWLHEP